jgi:hypothetical protein
MGFEEGEKPRRFTNEEIKINIVYWGFLCIISSNAIFSVAEAIGVGLWRTGKP